LDRYIGEVCSRIECGNGATRLILHHLEERRTDES
jgi:hypothetical protein